MNILTTICNTRSSNFQKHQQLYIQTTPKTSLKMTLYTSRNMWQNTNNTSNKRRLGCSVGIATDYGLDGPGSNPGGD